MTSYQRRRDEAHAAEIVLGLLRADALSLSHAWVTTTQHEVASCGCPACVSARRIQGIPFVRTQLRLSGVG